MSFRVYQYSLGAAALEAAGISFVELASAGSPLAKSTLVYPGSPPELPPIVYFTNPDRRPGMDNDTLILPPKRTLVKTLSSKVLVSFGETIVDREVKEIWTNEGGKLSMPTAFYRELRGYDENPPDPETLGNLVWSPANISTKSYEVQIVSLMGGSDLNFPDVSPEFRPLGGGGTVGGNVIAGPDGDLGVEFASSGWQTSEIVLHLRILSEVV